MRWLLLATWFLAACAERGSSPATTPAASGVTDGVRPVAPRQGPPRVDLDAGKDADDEPAGMLELINEYRRAAGVPPVVADPALTRGCEEHARYMVLNRGKPQLYSINAHNQDPSLPGATEAGAECGKRAVLYPSVNDLRSAVHGWMATLYHRAPIIAPNIDRVGIGASPLPTSMKRLAVALRFVYYQSRVPGWPVAYPADGQRDVPLRFTGESPTPIPPGGSSTPGYPFTLQFPAYDPLTAVKGTLVDAAGKEVPIYLSSPEQPASKYNAQHGLIGMIPVMQLEAGREYTATLHATWNGKPQTWRSTFRTMARVPVNADDNRALLAAIGRPARVRGVVKQTSRVSGMVTFKLHGPKDNTDILSIQVTAPRSVVEKVATLHPQTRSFYSLVGKTVELDAVPSIIFRTLRLDMTPVDRLRIVNTGGQTR